MIFLLAFLLEGSSDILHKEEPEKVRACKVLASHLIAHSLMRLHKV